MEKHRKRSEVQGVHRLRRFRSILLCFWRADYRVNVDLITGGNSLSLSLWLSGFTTDEEK